MRGRARAAVQMNLRLPEDMHEQVEAASTADDVDKSAWIREAIQERLDKRARAQKEVAVT